MLGGGLTFDQQKYKPDVGYSGGWRILTIVSKLQKYKITPWSLPWKEV